MILLSLDFVDTRETSTSDGLQDVKVTQADIRRGGSGSDAHILL